MALRFKLDENVPGEAAWLLREGGHDVSTTLDQKLGGSGDDRLLSACQDERRVLITLDQGFGDIRTYPPASHPGIWVLRPAAHDIELLLQLLRQALTATSGEPVSRRLWIVEAGRLRIRD